MKTVPQRKCIGCKNSFDKRDLVRIVRSPEGIVSLDLSGKKNGRGAYLCIQRECLNKARKNKGLERSFKMNIPETVYDTLDKEFETIETR